MLMAFYADAIQLYDMQKQFSTTIKEVSKIISMSVKILYFPGVIKDLSH
jgi:hypothetical protein